MNKENKTLIILSPGFPANEADSTCLPFPQLFVKTLKRSDPSLNIIVLAFQYPFIASEYIWHCVTVISFNGRNKGNISRLLLWKTVWERLNRLMKENNVLGILNFWLGECALIGKYAAKKYHVKNFTWLLGQDAKKNNRYFSLIKPKSENLIALSDFLAEEFYRNYRVMPANIIPPGIDTTIFHIQKTGRDIDILGAGSLIPLKQYDIFIQVVAAIAKSRPAIKAIICGKGPEQEKLQQMIERKKLSENIQLIGEIDHEQVLYHMQRSKVFLHPSSYEGFGIVIPEALFAGAYVVSFCKPMNVVFKNHYVVVSELELKNKVMELLGENNLHHEQVITFPMEETCRKILLLYRN